MRHSDRVIAFILCSLYLFVKGTITVLPGFRLRPKASYNDNMVSIALAKYTHAGQSVQQAAQERREDTPLVNPLWWIL